MSTYIQQSTDLHEFSRDDTKKKGGGKSGANYTLGEGQKKFGKKDGRRVKAIFHEFFFFLLPWL